MVLLVFHTGSLKVQTIPRSAFNLTKQKLELVVTNAKPAYRSIEKAKFRVFVRDFNLEYASSKLPTQLPSTILDKAYYRVRDIDSNEILIPFKRENNATRMSTDSAGLFFEVYMDVLNIGRTYTFDFLVIDQGVEFVVNAKNVRF